jgi:peptidoglycan/xylan/chitin deacetylase (PgdA/CDA1 family)
MAGLKSELFRIGLTALWYSGVARALEPLTRGVGTILMMHRVLPESAHGAFAPNRGLAIPPDYLDALLARFARDRIDMVTLDEALQRLAAPAGRPFVCFTADDGYRDNYEHAFPIFRRHCAPLTVYVTTGFIDGTMPLWWRVLEAAIASRDTLRVVREGREAMLATGDLAAKQRAFDALVPEFFRMTVAQLRPAIAQLAEDHDVDARAVSRAELCSWDMLREMKASGVVELGCHTVNHPVLALESAADARAEMADARAALEREAGGPVRHFAYPYGTADHAGPREFALARELGFATATTTRKASLQAEHRDFAYALPRVDVSPEFARSPHYLRTIVSGLPLLAWNRGRRVVVQ